MAEYKETDCTRLDWLLQGYKYPFWPYRFNAEFNLWEVMACGWYPATKFRPYHFDSESLLRAAMPVQASSQNLLRATTEPDASSR